MGKAYQVVRTFEKEVAKWAGAKYGVAVSSCCNALFLSVLYHHHWGEVTIPKYTYPGVAMAIINGEGWVSFSDEKWKGIYQLKPLPVIDSALRFRKGMYIKGTSYCLSFHYKKHLPIGRGGMILTDDKKAAEWFKMSRFDGRQEIPLSEDNASIVGWNMYMTPEQASRGLSLYYWKFYGREDLPDIKNNYMDLSSLEAYNV